MNGPFTGMVRRMRLRRGTLRVVVARDGVIRTVKCALDQPLTDKVKIVIAEGASAAQRKPAHDRHEPLQGGREPLRSDDGFGARDWFGGTGHGSASRSRPWSTSQVVASATASA